MNRLLFLCRSTVVGGVVSVVVSALGCSPARTEPAREGRRESATAPATAAKETRTGAEAPRLTTWVTTSMVKVGPTDPPGGAGELSLYAAQNELESAQIHVRAEGAAREGLSVELDALVSEDGAARIDGESITLSLEGYMNITRPSAPGARRGRVPDVLYPTRDTLTGEQRNAFPFEVPAGETRSVWIDVHVPAGTRPGVYQGDVRVLEGGAVAAKLPLSIQVWDFALPSTATLQSYFGATPLGACLQLFGSYEKCAGYPEARGNPDRGVELSHVALARLLLDHRMTSSEVVYAGSAKEGWRHFDHVYEPLLFGTAKTRLVGARLTTLAYIGEAEDMAFVKRWYDHAKQRAWDNRLVYYQCDEPPRTCSFEQVREQVRRVHGAAPHLPTLVTTDMGTAHRERFLDHVDILIPNVAQLHPRDEGSHRGEYSAFLKRPKKRLWWYQACSQHGRCNGEDAELPVVFWPSYMVDASPMQNRVFQWLAFHYGVSGELYYQVDHCWTHPCGDDKRSDPLASVYAFGGNGDGTLVYPGLPSRIGGTSPTILSSIRLEHIRDGFEDFEYLWMLQASGERALADEITATFAESAWRFDDDPRALEAARRRIGEHLHARATEAKAKAKSAAPKGKPSGR